LGHIVSRKGIEPNLVQIAALVNSAEPRNIKQVQRLTGMVAALGRFILRSIDKCKPFFRLLGVFGRISGDQDLLINSSMPFNSQSGRTTVFVFSSVRPCREYRFGSGTQARTEASLLRQ
jgi:hypothetical protein